MKLMRSRFPTLQGVICMYHRIFKLLLLISLALLVFSIPAFSAVIRVTPTGDDANDGSAWDDSHAKLTIAGALTGRSSGDEVWVKAGTYIECITLVSGVGVYGGFAGTETARTERDWTAHVTVIDGGAAGIVVTSPAGATSTTVIDGFTIQNGSSNDGGGGIYINSGSPTISNNTITGNTADDNNGYGLGGGIFIDSGSPTISNNIITGNTAYYGGGICINSGSPTISNNTITGNNADYHGGGICINSGSPTISNNTITGNNADYHGGGICIGSGDPAISNNTITANVAYSGGGIYIDLGSSPTISNNIITGNTAYYGGGIYIYYGEPTISNNTITGNTAANVGGYIYSGEPTIANNIVGFNSTGGIYYYTGSPTLRNNCVYGNTDYQYSGIAAGVGDISSDPAFVNRGGGDYHLTSDSPCIDVGENDYASADDVDMDGQDRIYDYPGKGTTDTVDIGADEVYIFHRIFHVDSAKADDTGDGLSWDAAKNTVQAAINACVSGDEVWVKAGTYTERITLVSGVGVYGGFAGTETARTERDWTAHVTVIDGGAAGRVVTSPVEATAATVIDGFTIQNGSSGNGGGIYTYYGSPTISNNTITGNTAANGGGGIYICDGSPTISNNTITGNNSGTVGGGISTYYGSPTISNNTITGNTASYYGGGISTYDGSPTISNNTITGNIALMNGGGIDILVSSPTISNNIVGFNSTGGIYYNYGSPTLRNNCVYGNTDYQYSGIAAGIGDISDDPLFVDKDGGDYHLTSDSPCIDVGENDYASADDVDMDGQDRIYDYPGKGTTDTVDIGADEMYQAAMPTFDPDGGGYSPARNAAGPQSKYIGGSLNVTVTCATDGATIHYTTNELDDPTEADPTVASGDTVSLSINTTLKARAFKTNWQPSEIKSADYTFTVATPVFDPANGEASSVTVTCATDGATIHYTTTGVDPTEGDPTVASGGSVAINQDLTLKAKAYKANWTTSAVGSAAYTIRDPIVFHTDSGRPDDSGDGLSWGTAKKTIQAAINVCVSGDEVWVKAGTYIECITLVSGVGVYGGFAGTEDVRTNRNWNANITVIDGGAAGSVVTSPDGATSATVIDGFTIRNGSSGDGGGGILISNGSPTISNNTITGNTASNGGGGGIYTYYSSSTITNNTITGNTASYYGGGIFTYYGSPTISNNTITGNTASYYGGGISTYDGSPTISNNTITGNTASYYGGGITIESSSPTISNNVVGFNSTGGIHYRSGSPILRNNCVYGNTEYQYSGIDAGEGDISDDPLFVNRAGGDLHLTRRSPCIDVGDDSIVAEGDLDMDGEPRIQGHHVDIGADESEYTQTGSDLDGDGKDDLVGLDLNGGIWYTTDKTSWIKIPGTLSKLTLGDLNGDGHGDIAGLSSTGKIYYTTNRNAWKNIPGIMSFLAAGDLNGNGTDDLAGISQTGKVYYTYNKTNWVNIPGSLASVAVGDLNKDGKDDVVGLSSTGKIYFSTDKATWKTIPGTLSKLVVGDFNGNGVDDIAGLNSSGKILYTTNKGVLWNNIPGTLASLAIGDFNGDGNDDIAGLSSAGKVYYTTNKTSWTNISGALANLTVGDLNGDGKDDIAGLGSSGSIWYTTNRNTWVNIPGTLAQLYCAR